MEHNEASKRAEIREIEISVGVRVRTARESANLSQQQLADALTERGITMHQTTVAKLERASRPIRVNEVVLIAQILGVPLTYLIGIDPLGAAERMTELNMAKIRAPLHELYRVRDFVGHRIKSYQAQIDNGDWLVETKGTNSDDSAT